VADRRDPDLLSCANEVDDHSRTGERLARAWRSLDGEAPAIERENHTARGGDGRFARASQCRPRSKARVVPKQEIAGSPVVSGAVDAVVAHELAKAQQRAHRVGVAHVVVLEERRRMTLCAGDSLPQIDRSVLEVDGLDLGDRRRLLAARLEAIVMLVEVGVLRWELVAIDDDPALRRF
jgi:hypothetical protein